MCQQIWHKPTLEGTLQLNNEKSIYILEIKRLFRQPNSNSHIPHTANVCWDVFLPLWYLPSVNESCHDVVIITFVHICLTISPTSLLTSNGRLGRLFITGLTRKTSTFLTRNGLFCYLLVNTEKKASNLYRFLFLVSLLAVCSIFLYSNN